MTPNYADVLSSYANAENRTEHQIQLWNEFLSQFGENGESATDEDCEAFLANHLKPEENIEFQHSTTGSNEEDQEPSNPFFKPFEDFFYEVACDSYTGQVMQNPIMTPDGYCYERHTLMTYLRDNNNLTPRGIRIPTNHEQRKKSLIPNTKLQRAIQTVVQDKIPGMSNEAVFKLYAEFSQTVAYDAVSTWDWIKDPAVYGVENNNRHEIRGGHVSLAQQNRELEAKKKVDPSVAAGAHLSRDDALLPIPIAYVKLQKAMIKLKGSLQNLDMNTFPKMTAFSELKELVNYHPIRWPLYGDEEPKPPVVQPPQRLDNMLARDQRTWWWKLGHLHQAWWTPAGFHMVIDPLIDLAIKVPVTLTIGTLFTPISAAARYFNPEQCEPDLPVDAVKKKAANELWAFTCLSLIQSGMLYATGTSPIYFYPVMKAAAELTELTILTNVVPAQVIVAALLAVYILLIATLLTAYCMNKIYPKVYPNEPVIGPQVPGLGALVAPDFTSTSSRPHSVPVFAIAAPDNAADAFAHGTQAPYLLWKKELNAVVQPEHEPIKLRI